VAASGKTELLEDSMINPVMGEIVDQKYLAERLLGRAKGEGVSLVAPRDLLSRLTKKLL
jgi:putative transposase